MLNKILSLTVVVFFSILIRFHFLVIFFASFPLVLVVYISLYLFLNSFQTGFKFPVVSFWTRQPRYVCDCWYRFPFGSGRRGHSASSASESLWAELHPRSAFSVRALPLRRQWCDGGGFSSSSSSLSEANTFYESRCRWRLRREGSLQRNCRDPVQDRLQQYLVTNAFRRMLRPAPLAAIVRAPSGASSSLLLSIRVSLSWISIMPLFRARRMLPKVSLTLRPRL